jgi:hypothetical protein
MPESFRTINSEEAKTIIAQISRLFDKRTQDYYAVVINARGELLGFTLPDCRTLNCIEAKNALSFSVACLYDCFRNNTNKTKKEEKVFFAPILEHGKTIGGVGFFTNNQILKEDAAGLINDFLRQPQLYFS